MKETERSFEAISDEDLTKLAAIAAEDRAAFYCRNPRYKDAEVLCVALCQGSALHYVNGDNGIKDFDIWTFYEGAQGIPDFPPRRLAQYDFGESRFGKHPDDTHCLGRRVDVIGRSIYVRAGGPPEMLQEYFFKGGTKSARFLAEKAVVLLEPADLRGVIVWPLEQADKRKS
ncbi:MAG TPA: hypothetical protein VI386_18260 [Candidatus Sulfotelmatobacter sp.]